MNGNGSELLLAGSHHINIDHGTAPGHKVN